MFRAGIKVLLAISATRAMAQYEGDTCKLTSNDFEHTKCGEGTDKVCCKTREACITSNIKVGTEWKDQYECSGGQSMYGTKILKIILIPLVLLIFDILAIVFMMKKLDKSNPITKFGCFVVGLTWPLFFSEKWILGFYSAALAVFVAFVNASLNKAQYPVYIYRMTWALQAFQLVLLLGPVETLHVPFFNQSLAGTSTALFPAFAKITEASCSTYYEDFFKLTANQLKIKEANPDLQYAGFCSLGYLCFVQMMLIIQAIAWFANLLISAPVFLNGTPLSCPSGKAKTEDPGPVQVVPAAKSEEPADVGSTPVEVIAPAAQP